tara:strand:- start:300 stop:923 length:624 start_codon:yes stop_codon:yes gene_type:complete
MSFRTEEKSKFHTSDYLKLISLIQKEGGHTLFPKRKISSLYFDNKELSMFLDSEEGSVPRKKLRIRHYPESLNEYFLEKKIASVEGKFKTSKKITEKHFKHLVDNGIFDLNYGNCYPLINVSYFREYFKIDDIRLTLDTNLIYKTANNKNNYHDQETIILEIKSNQKVNDNIFEKNLPFEKLRFSKYCEGMKKLYGKNEYQRMFSRL